MRKQGTNRKTKGDESAPKTKPVDESENGDVSNDEETIANSKSKGRSLDRKRKRKDDDEEETSNVSEDGKNEDEEKSSQSKGKKVAKGKKSNTDSEAGSDNAADAKESDEEELPLSKKMKAVKKTPAKNGVTKGKKRAAELEEKAEFEVESVVGSRMLRGKRQFRIRWKGFKEEDDTWEAEEGLDCAESIEQYLAAHPDDEEQSTDGPQAAKSGKKASKKIKTKKGDRNTKANEDEEKEAVVSKEEYEVDRIVDMFLLKDGKREFLIRWKGYNNKDNTWEPEEHLNCRDLIDKYLLKVEAAKAVSEKELRVGPKPTERFTLTMGGSGRRVSRRGTGKQRTRYDDAE